MNLRKLFETVAWASMIIIFASFILIMPKMGIDFYYLRPAGEALLKGKDIYFSAPFFFNPPWAAVIIAPFSLFPLEVGRYVWMIAGIFAYWVGLNRFQIPKMKIMALMISPFVYFDLGVGNMDWLILLGATLPISIGAWIVFIKPQTSLALIGLWVKQKQWTALIPAVLLLFLFLLQLWQLPDKDLSSWNTSIFPFGIPLGIIIAYKAYKQQDPLLSLACMPFFTPYLAFQSWFFVLLPIARKKPIWLIFALILSWIGALFYFV